jgi:hypothetical protein
LDESSSYTLDPEMGAPSVMAVSNTAKRQLAVGTTESVVLLFNTSHGKLQLHHRFAITYGSVMAIAWMPGRDWLCAGGENDLISVFSDSARLAQEKSQRTEKGEGGGTIKAFFSATSSRSVTEATALKQPSPPVLELDGHTSFVACVTFGLDGKLMFSAGLDGIIICWGTEAIHAAGMVKIKHKRGSLMQQTMGLVWPLFSFRIACSAPIRVLAAIDRVEGSGVAGGGHLCVMVPSSSKQRVGLVYRLPASVLTAVGLEVPAEPEPEPELDLDLKHEPVPTLLQRPAPKTTSVNTLAPSGKEAKMRPASSLAKGKASSRRKATDATVVTMMEHEHEQDGANVGVNLHAKGTDKVASKRTFKRAKIKEDGAAAAASASTTTTAVSKTGVHEGGLDEACRKTDGTKRGRPHAAATLGDADTSNEDATIKSQATTPTKKQKPSSTLKQVKQKKGGNVGKDAAAAAADAALLSYTTTKEDENPTTIAALLACEVDELVQQNLGRYPGLTATSRLRQKTTLWHPGPKEEPTSKNRSDAGGGSGPTSTPLPKVQPKLTLTKHAATPHSSPTPTPVVPMATPVAYKSSAKSKFRAPKQSTLTVATPNTPVAPSNFFASNSSPCSVAAPALSALPTVSNGGVQALPMSPAVDDATVGDSNHALAFTRTPGGRRTPAPTSERVLSTSSASVPTPAAEPTPPAAHILGAGPTITAPAAQPPSAAAMPGTTAATHIPAASATPAVPWMPEAGALVWWKYKHLPTWPMQVVTVAVKPKGKILLDLMFFGDQCREKANFNSVSAMGKKLFPFVHTRFSEFKKGGMAAMDLSNVEKSTIDAENFGAALKEALDEAGLTEEELLASVLVLDSEEEEEEDEDGTAPTAPTAKGRAAHVPAGAAGGNGVSRTGTVESGRKAPTVPKASADAESDSDFEQESGSLLLARKTSPKRNSHNTISAGRLGSGVSGSGSGSGSGGGRNRSEPVQKKQTKQKTLGLVRWFKPMPTPQTTPPPLPSGSPPTTNSPPPPPHPCSELDVQLLFSSLTNTCFFPGGVLRSYRLFFETSIKSYSLQFFGSTLRVYQQKK